MLIQPPALQAPAPPAPKIPPPKSAPRAASRPAQPLPSKPATRAEAEDILLQAFDDGRTLPVVAVAAKDRGALAWLRLNAGAAGDGAVAKPGSIPFRPGSTEHREVLAWRAFLASPLDVQIGRLPDLSLSLSGTQLGFWRWGRQAAFTGRLSPEARKRFEDRLAASPVALLRGFGLRHALCHAVAAWDVERFTELRQRHDILDGDLFHPFQRLFALKDGGAPKVRLFTLPGLQMVDTGLDQLGGQRIWMMPAANGLNPLPPDVAWIIPGLQGQQAENESRLLGSSREEAEKLATRLGAAGRHAWFAASRGLFETYGLVYFPILIDLDAEGRVHRIRMGDAAPEKP